MKVDFGLDFGTLQAYARTCHEGNNHTMQYIYFYFCYKY